MRVTIDGKEYQNVQRAALETFGAMTGKRKSKQTGVRVRVKTERGKDGRIRAYIRPDNVNLRKLTRWCKLEGRRLEVMRRGIWAPA